MLLRRMQLRVPPPRFAVLATLFLLCERVLGIQSDHDYGQFRLQLAGLPQFTLSAFVVVVLLLMCPLVLGMQHGQDHHTQIDPEEFLPNSVTTTAEQRNNRVARAK
ncbi:unnamed protein product, partial [Amoebophrya sp. A25]|eukprot:GSA25T00009567001.1